ncbi:hypothetical protein EUX98_g2416 [Antrodiella citrinella]|uniref:Protein kinase domain-containing protein n=1 Tax=Antrodiella citrinella TaxID=2447956 RepID=A0A4S4N0E2_9APHY|nr:hypothetical protein EUX98_g2416 [Antrodiella citrinella]
MKLMILNNSDNVEQILGILNNPEEVHRVADLQRTGAPVAERLMDAGKRRLQVLREQHGDSSRPVESEAYRQTERGMSELFTMTGIPPTLRNLNGEITRPDDLPYVGGVHSDVWIGYWLGDQKVSPWQNNGNVLEKPIEYIYYVKLSGAAEGLAYLHTEKVVHGNVRCANILVAIGGEAVICDFGMSKIREETSAQSATMTLTTQGSTRWMSPELLDALVTSPTTQCDIYSFGMTMLECFTLQPPFTEIKRDFHFISLMSKGPLTPKRPMDEAATKWISEDVWKLMTDSWSRDPEKRPEMKEVVSSIHAIEMTARASAFSPSSTPTPTSTPPSVIQTPTPVVQS